MMLVPSLALYLIVNFCEKKDSIFQKILILINLFNFDIINLMSYQDDTALVTFTS